MNKSKLKINNVLNVLVFITILLAILFLSGCAREAEPPGGCGLLDGSGPGPLEAGRCYGSQCDERCNKYFPGSRGECPLGAICDVNCSCVLVDKDLDGWPDIKDDNYYFGEEIEYKPYHFYDGLIFEIKDGQPVFLPEDCDDNNSAIHPLAPEICNLVDDDCSSNDRLKLD